MTPEAAAEGRRLLDALDPSSITYGNELAAWLWANREELVRCAELVADQPAPTETAPAPDCMCGNDPHDLHCDLLPWALRLHEAATKGNSMLDPGEYVGGDGRIRKADPRLAHALANPPGPRHVAVREALASARLDGETVPLETEPQGASTCPQDCDWPNPGAPCPRCWPEAKGAPQKPEGD